jgi:hypothetical protein
MPSEKVMDKNISPYEGISVFELSKRGMPQKGLKSGLRGSKILFNYPYREQSQINFSDFQHFKTKKRAVLQQPLSYLSASAQFHA